MKRKRHTAEEIIKKLREAAGIIAGGKSVEAAAICRRARWAKPSTTRCPCGPCSRSISKTARIEIDNTPVENAIRPTAIGKKNWLFIGEAEAGQLSAILFTLIEACRSPGIDPQTYLRDVLTRLPTLTNWQIKDVTPAAWAKSRRPAVQRIAA